MTDAANILKQDETRENCARNMKCKCSHISFQTKGLNNIAKLTKKQGLSFSMYNKS